jgi:hypothetical protein
MYHMEQYMKVKTVYMVMNLDCVDKNKWLK